MTDVRLSPWLRWLDSARHHDRAERVRSAERSSERDTAADGDRVAA